MDAKEALKYFDNELNCYSSSKNVSIMTKAFAYQEAIKALEKQIPMKPANLKEMYMDFGNGQKIGVDAYGDCPTCKNHLYNGANYCSKCGQKLDWGEE